MSVNSIEDVQKDILKHVSWRVQRWFNSYYVVYNILDDYGQRIKCPCTKEFYQSNKGVR